MSAGNRSIQSRRDWQRTEGFALYTDVSDAMLADLSRIREQLAPVSDSTNGLQYHEQNPQKPAAMSLYMGMLSARDVVSDNAGKHFRKRYHITPADRRRAAPYTFEGGFDDLTFPWHFSAALASAAVDHFEEQGVISKEQKDQLTLPDWANIIGSGWFSNLSHQLALARNGTYGSFGTYPRDYLDGALRQKLTHKNIIPKTCDTIFDYQEQLEPEENRIYATANANKLVVKGLRDAMKHAPSASAGCPVARKSVMLPNNVARSGHAANLIREGTLATVPERSHNGFTRATQDSTAIDRTLAFFAMQLDDYHRIHGTPYLEESDLGVRVRHRHQAPLDILSWPAAVPEP